MCVSFIATDRLQEVYLKHCSRLVLQVISGFETKACPRKTKVRVALPVMLPTLAKKTVKTCRSAALISVCMYCIVYTLLKDIVTVQMPERWKRPVSQVFTRAKAQKQLQGSINMQAQTAGSQIKSR